MSPNAIDVLAIGPHPDDVELFMGGTLLKLSQMGYRTAILDLTRGELSTNGTVAIREKEAREAAFILKVESRHNAALQDGDLRDSAEQRAVVVKHLRSLKPRIIFAPWSEDHHPDHVGANALVRSAVFLAGLKRFDPDSEAHRTGRLIFYPTHGRAMPSFVVDISDQFEDKKRACQAYQSQFYNPEQESAKTYISRKEFWSWWEARSRQAGQLIAKEFGEGFVIDLPVPVEDPVSVFSGHDLYPQLKEST